MKKIKTYKDVMLNTLKSNKKTAIVVMSLFIALGTITTVVLLNQNTTTKGVAVTDTKKQTKDTKSKSKETKKVESKTSKEETKKDTKQEVSKESETTPVVDNSSSETSQSSGVVTSNDNTTTNSSVTPTPTPAPTPTPQPTPTPTPPVCTDTVGNSGMRFNSKQEAVNYAESVRIDEGKKEDADFNYISWYKGYEAYTLACGGWTVNFY